MELAVEVQLVPQGGGGGGVGGWQQCVTLKGHVFAFINCIMVSMRMIMRLLHLLYEGRNFPMTQGKQ
jgi:hypothetical protein